MDQDAQISKEFSECHEFIEKCGNLLTNPEEFLLLGYIFASKKDIPLSHIASSIFRYQLLKKLGKISPQVNDTLISYIANDKFKQFLMKIKAIELDCNEEPSEPEIRAKVVDDNRYSSIFYNENRNEAKDDSLKISLDDKIDGTLPIVDSNEQTESIRKEEEEKSAAFIKELQEEDIKQQKSLTKKMECLICAEEFEEIDGYVPENCNHILHKDCLLQHIQYSIKESKFPILCPFTDCNIQLTEFDLKKLLNDEEYKKYEKFAIKNFADQNADQYSCCPTNNCDNIFFFTPQDSSDFFCPVCKIRYCLNCHVEYHSKMTCQEYKITNTHTEDDDKFIKFVTGSKFKQCPKCKYWVEKTVGCDHMTCKCGKQFCYKCGGDYGKCECMAAPIQPLQMLGNLFGRLSGKKRGRR